MKISLSMWSVHQYWYEGKWSIIDFLDFAALTKATGVELLSIFWRDQAKELPLVEEALRKHNLKAACYSACNNFVSADPNVRLAQVKEVTDSIDMAVRFGAPIVRVFSGDLPNNSITFEQGMEFVIEGLAAAAKYAVPRV